MDKTLPKDFKLSPSIEKYVSEDAPLEARLMAARGLLPLEPIELVTLLYILLYDKNAEVKKEAHNSIENIPEKLLENVLSADLHPEILDFFAKKENIEQKFLAAIIKNRKTRNNTITLLASGEDPHLLEIISLNQERMLQDNQIMEILINNPHLNRVAQDKVLSLYHTNVLSKRVEDQEGEFLEVDEELKKLETPPPTPKTTQKADEETLESINPSIAKKINSMKLSEKIKLALFGGMEARSILIRSPNRLVSKSVVKSPKVTETEIINFTQSRNIDEEILKLIGGSKQWTKSYQIKSNLVSNPKTPLSTAIKFLSHLREFDLKRLVKSRDVQAGVQTAARKILLKKR